MSLLALLAAVAAGEPLPPEPEPLLWRNVVTGTRHPTNTNGSQTSVTETHGLTLCRDATEVRVVYSTRLNSTEQTVTYSCSIDGQGVTWGGLATVDCPPRSTVTSDPLPISKAAGAVLSVTTTAATPSPGVPYRHSWEGGLVPVRIEAESTLPSCFIIGSSTGTRPQFDHGFRDALLPAMNCSGGGSRAANWDDDQLDRAGLDGPHGYTHALLQVGINSNGQGVMNWLQSQVDLAWRLRGRGIGYVAQKVWKPHTTSTDGWSTVAGQAPRYSDRATAVAWLRAGAPVTASGLTVDLAGASPGRLYVGQPGHPFSAIVDWSALLQAPSNPDAYRVDHGPITTDGLHINEVGYGLGKPAIQAWAESIA